MAPPIPTLDDLRERILADFAARFPLADLSPFSDNYKRCSVLAGAVWGVYHHQKLSLDALFPDTAEGTDLDRIGTIWNVSRKGATAARKSDALRVFGANGSTFTLGDQLTSKAGLTYQLNENGTVPSAGFIDVDVVAVDVGAATQLLAGDTLTFISPPAGIEAVAELQLDLDEDGVDQEDDGAYRARILDKISQPGMGGNANDYRTWALEVTGVASAYVYPLRRGRGSVDLAALHSGRGTVRLLTAGERTELQDYIDERRPVSMKMFRVIEVTSQVEDVVVAVKARPGTQYEWDWDDTTPPTVASWTAGTRTLELSVDRPGDMEVGDRIVIKTVAGNGSGEQHEIEAFGAAADEIVLREAPSVAPAVGDTVYSGGDLTDLVRDAALLHFDELGPAVGNYGTGEWDDVLEPGRLEALAFAIAGVRDVSVITPASAVTPDDPAFPNDATIELLIPGEVVVRRLH